MAYKYKCSDDDQTATRRDEAKMTLLALPSAEGLCLVCDSPRGQQEGGGQVDEQYVDKQQGGGQQTGELDTDSPKAFNHIATDLLEAIFLHMSNGDLITSQRACKRFRNVIERSGNLQRKLCLAAPMKDSTQLDTLDPLLVQHYTPDPTPSGRTYASYKPGIVIHHLGRYYEAERFYNIDYNPAIEIRPASSMKHVVEWELREIDETIKEDEDLTTTALSLDTSSLGAMYLSNTALEIHLAVWKGPRRPNSRGNPFTSANELRLRRSSARYQSGEVVDIFHGKPGQTVREMFDEFAKIRGTRRKCVESERQSWYRGARSDTYSTQSRSGLAVTREDGSGSHEVGDNGVGIEGEDG